MTELLRSHAQDEPSEIDADNNAQLTDRRIAKPTGLTHAGTACQSLEFFGSRAAWGLAVLGLLASVVHILDSGSAATPDPPRVGSAVLGTLCLLLAYCLAGWGVGVITRLTASTILDWLEHAARASERQSITLTQAVAQLERIGELLVQSGGQSVSRPDRADGRAHSITEVAHAIRAANWADAQTRLDELEATFPDDPELSALREQLARARHAAVQSTLAELSAAREVNDPDRVLEIYQLVQPSLDQAAHAALERDLAKWFLSLIHRRLRLGKVQPDVVHLASRFAESFASTMEGASVPPLTFDAQTECRSLSSMWSAVYRSRRRLPQVR